jgi:hypothetical protein
MIDFWMHRNTVQEGSKVPSSSQRTEKGVGGVVLLFR